VNIFNIAAGILIALFLTPVVLGLALLFGRFSPVSRKILIVLLLITGALDAGLVIFRKEFHSFALARYSSALEQSKAADAQAQRLADLTACADRALDQTDLDKCYANLDPELREKLRNQMADSANEKSDEENGPIVVDCSNAALAAEKIVCNTPELKALNEQLKNLYNSSNDSDRDEWRLKFREILSCKDSLVCIKKSYQDQIYRMTH
jgi:uncharacterized protein